MLMMMNLPLQVPVCANDAVAIKVNVNATNIFFIFLAISHKDMNYSHQ